MKKFTKLFVAACSVLAIAGLSAQDTQASVSIDLVRVGQSSEYYTSQRLWYAPYGMFVTSPDESKFEITNVSKATFKMTVRGDYFERCGYAPYQTEEFKTGILALSYYYVNKTSTSKYLSVDNISISQDGETLYSEAGKPALELKSNPTVSVNTLVFATNYWIDFPDFKKDKFYEISFTLSHAAWDSDSVRVIIGNEQRDDLAECVATYSGDNPYTTEITTVADGNTTTTYSTSHYAIGAWKYTKELGSGKINMLDETGSPVTVDNGALTSDWGKKYQPNGKPIVRMYDINDKKWLATAKQNYEEGYNQYKLYSADNVLRATGNYMLEPSDSTIARHDFTEENYCEMELTDGTTDSLRFNFPCLDVTHSYLLVAASFSAGYSAIVWNYRDGKVKEIHSLSELDDYVPPVIAPKQSFYSRKYIAEIDMQLTSTVTGIDDINAEDAESNVETVYYDLSGRSSSKPFSGVNIVKRGSKVTKELHQAQ